jgi:hypothetical protein
MIEYCQYYNNVHFNAAEILLHLICRELSFSACNLKLGALPKPIFQTGTEDKYPWFQMKPWVFFMQVISIENNLLHKSSLVIGLRTYSIAFRTSLSFRQ